MQHVSSTHEIEAAQAPYEVNLVLDWLQNGKSELGWPGDPRLYIQLGVITAASHGFDRRHSGNFFRKGDVVAHQIQVWRHNEDGTDKIVLQRKSSDWHEIIPAIAGMRPGSPAFVDPVTEVETHNDKMRQDNSDDFRGHTREMTEHLWRLVHDRQEGPNTFRQMPGRNPDKQD